MFALRRPARPPFATLTAITALALLAAWGLAGGCGRADRNRSGYKLLAPVVASGDTVRDTVLAGTLAETDFEFAAGLGTAGASPRLVVADEPGVLSRALIHFLAPPVDSTNFRRATLDVSLDDSLLTGAPALELLELVEPFSETLRGDQSFPGFIDMPIATGAFIAPHGDTTGTVRFEGAGLDSLVSEWVATGSRQHVNAGLLLRLAPGLTSKVNLRSREATVGTIEVRPYLTTYYHPAGTPADSELSIRSIPDRDVFLAQPNDGGLAGVPGRLVVASGVPCRALLRFDMSAFTGSVIHRAILRMAVDTTATSADSLSIIADAVSDSVWSGQTTVATTTGAATGALVVDNNQLEMEFTITTIARSWALGASENRGLLLHAANEYATVSWMHFLDSTASDSLKPRLEITYSPVTGVSP